MSFSCQNALYQEKKSPHRNSILCSFQVVWSKKYQRVKKLQLRPWKYFLRPFFANRKCASKCSNGLMIHLSLMPSDRSLEAKEVLRAEYYWFFETVHHLHVRCDALWGGNHGTALFEQKGQSSNTQKTECCRQPGRIRSRDQRRGC